MSGELVAIQLVSTAVVEDNLSRVAVLIKEAAEQGAKLVVLPENFAFMGKREGDKLPVSETEGDGPIQQLISSLAKALEIWIVAGTIPLKTEDKNRVAAASLVYNELGQQVGRYDKIHLFDVNLPDGSGESYKESATIEKGTALATVLDSPVGRLGVAVCYDLRFPELFRALLEGGLDVVAIPAAFTEKTGQAHWELLLRARAVENQCYLIGANQGGLHENGRTTFGNSLIVDPWGAVLARQIKGEGVVAATFDSAKQDEIRAQFPVLAHRQKYH